MCAIAWKEKEAKEKRVTGTVGDNIGQARAGGVFLWARKWLKQSGRWHERDCNTYRSEITNGGHTCEGCGLNAPDCPSATAWSGRQTSEKKFHPQRLGQSEKNFFKNQNKALANQKRGKSRSWPIST